MVKQDWECYYDRYDDLQRALAKTKQAMNSHYNNYGKSEGRVWGCVAERTAEQLEIAKRNAAEAGISANDAKQNYITSNLELEKVKMDTKQVSQYKDDSSDYVDSAKRNSQLALKLSEKSQNSYNELEESQKNIQKMQQNAESDVGALQNVQGILGYTGTAIDMSRRLNVLQEQEEQLKKIETNMPLSKDVVEGHLFAFQKDGYSYLESLDEQQKINILRHMVKYYQDFADIYRSITIELNDDDEKDKKLRNEINAKIPEWFKDNTGNIDKDILFKLYYYTKYNYENSGSETLGYQLFLKIKNVLSTMFNSNTMKNATPGFIFSFLNSDDNEEVSKLKYTYYLENKSKQPFTNIKEYFTNLIEGNTGMSETDSSSTYNQDSYIDILRGALDTTQTNLNNDRTNLENSINNIKRYQDGEFLAQRDTIMNNVLMDYMINNKEGSNIERVYEKLNQEKNDKLRKTKIAAYYTKSFKEYIYLLKIVIFLIVLMIPILIFNRLEILDKSLTLLLVVIIITLGFLYISYRLYILYMRDSKDFDKFKIPFTRTEAANLKSKGSRYSKDSPFKSLGITCVGEECCDASMVYDKLRDKCVATENFGNYFENAQELNNQQKNIIKENNSHEDESNFAFLGGNADIIENFRSKEGLKRNILLESLKNSSITKF